MTLTCTCLLQSNLNQPRYCPMHGCPHDDRAHCDCRTETHRPRGCDGVKPDLVNAPPHYLAHPSGVEPLDIRRHLSNDVGDAFKYVFRAPYKGTEHQDLDKARFYLEDAIEHADPIFLPSWSFRTGQLLDRVCEHETAHNRWAFFRGLKVGNLHQCLVSTNAMLAGT